MTEIIMIAKLNQYNYFRHGRKLDIIFLYTYDLMNIIDIILCIRSKVIDNDVKSYMYYFKSRLLYFNNDYDGALEYTDKSISTI